METSFPTKGIALISLINAGFSLNQCAKILGFANGKKASVLAAATRRRGNAPMPISEEVIIGIEKKFGVRSGGKRAYTTIVGLGD